MSKTYTDLTETQFPDQIDELSRMSDLSYSDIPVVSEYYRYYNAGNLTAAAELLANNPSLLGKLFNAAKFNILRDALIALQRYYKSDVQAFIEATRGTLEEEVEQFTPMGDYDHAVTYRRFNVVLYDGCSYLCKKDTLTGVAPTAGETDDNWGLLALRGIQGASGTGLSWRGAYNEETNYYIDDCVTDGVTMYAALQNSIGIPLSNRTYWEPTISVVNTYVDDVTGVGYRLGIENGIMYIEEE